MSANELRMPFAEWLYRMHEANLAPQARVLAVYAAAFHITNNDELGQLAGMVSDKGVTNRTYDKYKAALLAGGWVIISRRKGGRGLGIQVAPAYQETPVKFTDLSPRNPSKYCTRIEEEETPVEFAVSAGNTPAKSAETPVDPAPLSQRSPRTPLKDNNNNTHTTAGSDELVTVNGVAIHGPGFSLDFAAIDMVAGLVGGDTKRARILAEICARDWATNGTKPNNPMAQVKAAIMADFRRGQAGAPTVPQEGRRERMRKHAEEVEQRLNQRGKHR